MFKSTTPGTEVRGRTLLDQGGDWISRTERGEVAPVASYHDGDDVYIDCHFAGMDWKLYIRRDGDGRAEFQLLALPPEGQELTEPIELEGEASISGR